MSSATKKKAPYKGTQQNFYSVGELSWNYFLLYQPLFAKQSPRYTEPFGLDNLKKIADAKAMPSQKARNEAFLTARNTLLADKLAAANDWQLLKGYITDAFPKEDQLAKLNAAGQKEYQESGTEPRKFDVFTNMLNMAKLFITANQAALLDKDIMPPDFPQRFPDSANKYAVSLTDYILKQGAAEQGAKDKMDADKAILANLTPMQELGKKIFRNDPVKIKLFTYDDILDTVRGNSPSGFKGVMTNALTKKPIKDVTIAIPDAGISAVTDAKGKFELKVASGTHNLVVSAPGFETVTLEGKKLTVGTMSRLSLALTPVVQPTDPPQISAAPENGKAEEELVAELVMNGNGV